jgi:hypothetical protein
MFQYPQNPTTILAPSAYLYRDTLEKLAAEPPTTKTALLCSLLLEIEGARRSGKTHKQIWQRLSDAGLDITCETFCRLIRRARKKTRISAARGGKVSKSRNSTLNKLRPAWNTIR